MQMEWVVKSDMEKFYENWGEKRNTGTDDSDYLISFIRGTTESVQPLFEGSDAELATVFSVLKQVPIEEFLAVVQNEEIARELIPADVPCFSTLENGASRLNELLEFEPDGLTFADAGYQLMNSVKPGARVKYGENHSKLAAMMSLVTISSNRPAIVRPTRWGTYLTRYDWRSKEEVLRKLLLRDLCVKTVVKSALIGPTTYRDAVKVLSTSTAIRRRTNVRCLIEFVLSGTDREEALSRIDWEV